MTTALNAERVRRAAHMWEEAGKLKEGGLLHMDCAARPARVLRVTQPPDRPGMISAVISDGEGEQEQRAVINFTKGEHVAEFEWAGGYVLVTLIEAEAPQVGADGHPLR